VSRGQILVVDDEEKIQKLVRLYLEREGYSVRCCGTGDAALEEARRHPPDLIVLDLLLPGKDGIEVCRALRATSDVPIILLTARTTERDKLVGLGSGADDYVTKPFSPLELVARVGAVLRRVRRGAEGLADGEDPPSPVEAAGILVDPGSREARVGGRPVSLTPTEFRLLTALVREPGRAFTRAQLIERAFGMDFDGFDRNVDVHIMNLRKKLGIDPTPIRTVYGVGYKLEAP
jgi:DNA-binding response OmpR family regulator